MSKTLIYLIVFIIILIGLAYVFSLFLVPEQKIRYAECILLQNPQTQEVDCYGCVQDVCKDAPVDWIIYQKPTTGTTIPYTCFAGESGCQLAQ